MNVGNLTIFINFAHSKAYNFVQGQLKIGNFAISKNNKLRSKIDEFELSKGEFPEVIKKRRVMHKVSTIYEKTGKGLKIVTDQIKNTEDYKILIKEQDAFSLNIINNLCEFIANQVLRQINITKILVDQIAYATNKSLTTRKVIHITNFYTQGLFIKKEYLEIQFDSVILRIKQPNPENVAEYDDFFDHGISFNSILEIETQSNDTHIEFGDYFQKYITPLQLYGIMDLDYTAQLTHSYFMTYHGLYSHGYIGAKLPNHKFVIKDANDFSEKVRMYYNKLTEQGALNPIESNTKAYSIHIALNRYKIALAINKDEGDRKITEIIMGLEALYLSGQEKETLGFKLNYRITQVFVQLQVDYELLLKIIATAYSVRSSFAHGSAKEKKLNEKLEKIELKIGDLKLFLLNLLRESILIFLYFDNTKLEFIELINASFVDTKSRNELIMLIHKTRMKYSTNLNFTLNNKNNNN